MFCVSFEIPEYTGDVTALGTVRLLDAIRESGIKTKFLIKPPAARCLAKWQKLPSGETIAVSALQSLRLCQALCVLGGS